MARWMVALRGERPAQCVAEGIEVHLAQCENVFGAPADDGADASTGSGGFSALTLLVNLSADSDDRSSFAVLPQLLSFADASVHVLNSEDCWAEMSALIASAGDGMDVASAVVYVGAKEAKASPRAQRAVHELHSALGAKLDIVVVVDASGQVAPVTDESVQVHGVTVATSATAIGVYALLCSTAAPVTLTCLDADMISALWEPPLGRVVMADAFWIREAGELCFASDSDREAVRGATAIVALPICVRLSSIETRRIMNSVRAQLPEAARFMYAACVDFVSTARAHPRLCLMPILCRLPPDPVVGGRNPIALGADQ